MSRLGAWFSRTFGATPADAGPDALVVIYEGSASECQIVGLRLKTAGLLVHPDPSPRFVGLGRGGWDPTYAGRGNDVSAVTVSVLATDERRARAILDDVEPI